MKRILLFVFFALFSLTVNGGVRTFPLNVPQEENLVFACKEKMAAILIAKLASEDRRDDLNTLGPQLVSQGICAFGSGTLIYTEQVFKTVTEHGLFTVYAANAGGIVIYVTMKDYEHSSL